MLRAAGVLRRGPPDLAVEVDADCGEEGPANGNRAVKPSGVFWLAAISILAFFGGALSQRSGLLSGLIPKPPSIAADRQPLREIPAWKQPFVLIAAGQSNAANHGTPPARSGAGTYALAASGIYPLADPLPGAS